MTSAAIPAVFADFDSCAWSFTPRIEQAILMYPVMFVLFRGEFDALAQAAASVGDQSFIVKDFEGNDQQEWHISLSDYRQYEGLPLTENVLCSPSSQWGAIFSAEDHALIGGTGPFMTEFSRAWPRDIRSDAVAFCRFWKLEESFGADVTWVDPLLRHLFSDAERERIRQLAE